MTLIQMMRIGPSRWLGNPHTHVVHGGGGGNQTSTTGTPDWAKPFVEDALGQAVGAHGRGDLNKVAGFNADQEAAFGQARDTAGQSVSNANATADTSRAAQQGAFDTNSADNEANLGEQRDLAGGLRDQLTGTAQAGADETRALFGRQAEKSDALEAASQDAIGTTFSDARTGSGVFGTDVYGETQAGLKDQIGREQAQRLGALKTSQSLQGALGSARSQASQDKALSDVAFEQSANEVQQRRSAALQGAQQGLQAQQTIGQGGINNLTNRTQGLSQASNNLFGQQQGIGQNYAGTLNQVGQQAIGNRSQLTNNLQSGLQNADSTQSAAGYQAADALGQIGSAQQGQAQAEGDATHQGLQRLFGYLGSGAVGSKTTQTGGGK